MPSDHGRLDRLMYEPLNPGHAREMVEVLASWELYRNIGGTPPDLTELEQRYTRQAVGSPDPSVVWSNWVLRRRADGQPVGYVQATMTEVDGHARAELAWVVGRPWQGQGHATEAAAWLLEEVAARGAVDVVALIAPANTASAEVARRVGLRPTGAQEDGEDVWSLGTGA